MPAQLQPPSFGGNNPDCDTLKSDAQIKKFRDFITDVIERYEGNIVQQELAEREEMDLRHAIELADHLTDSEKRLLFRKMRSVLKVRRSCKSENEILQPLYDFVSDRQLYNQLGRIQGGIKSKKEILMGRQYGCRTSILDGFRQREPE